jgi:hypothetical protein
MSCSFWSAVLATEPAIDFERMSMQFAEHHPTGVKPGAHDSGRLSAHHPTAFVLAESFDHRSLYRPSEVPEQEVV